MSGSGGENATDVVLLFQVVRCKASNLIAARV